MALPESIVDKLKKIKALAEQGEEGEKDNAKALLKALLTKYETTEEAFFKLIKEEQERYVSFRAKDEGEKILLFQIISKIKNVNSISYTQNRKRYAFLLTFREAIDVEEFYNFYRKELKKEIVLLVKGFCSSNRITSSIQSNKQIEEIDWDEWRKILSYASTITPTSPLKKLKA